MKRIVTVLAALTLAACAASTSGPDKEVVAADVKAHQRVTLLDVPNKVDRAVVFVIENKSFSQMKAGAPFIWGMGQKFSYATNFTATTHPSLPNYIDMGTGSTQGIKDDKGPSSHKITKVGSVLGNTIKAGRSAKVVADGMGDDRCRQSNYHSFAVRHGIWPYFPNERPLCERYMFDYKFFDGDVKASKLANVEFVIPSNAHNAHDGSLKAADDWVKRNVERVTNGPQYKNGDVAIVITADEDNRKEGNRILTVVIHPSLSGKVVTTPLTIPSLHKFLAQVGHTTPTGNGPTAPDMAAAFGLSIN